MADDLSVQLLAFNFASRIYAYKCLAQGLSKTVTGFSSFISAYLDPCTAADICTQYMDDIALATNILSDLTMSLDIIFQCIRRSGLKPSPSKCQFGVPQTKRLGNLISSNGITPKKNKKFLAKVKMPRTIIQIKSILGFYQLFRNFIPNLNEKLLPFHRFLKKDTEIVTDNTHNKALETVINDLIKATEVTVRPAKPDLQNVILTDAS